LVDIEGALWRRALIEDCRTAPMTPGHGLKRIVIGVDPPASGHGDACGIIAAGLDAAGMAHVLEDASVERVRPEQWARMVTVVFHRWQADRIVAEANNGGDMVRSVLHALEAALPVRLVHASRGKAARAEPVSALYEAGRVRHAGTFPRLEDELCGLIAGGGYEGPGRSPDRADALVWAITELLLSARVDPRLRML
jgi:phage terminase large subunit-like protein